MTELELREQILNLQEELEATIKGGETEQRELNEEENTRLAELRSQIEEKQAELAQVEEENKKLAERHLNNNNNTENNNKKMEKKEIRLFDLVKEIANGNVSEEHRSYVNGNNISFRAAIQATAEGAGQENVPTDKAPLELAIRNASVLDKLGVTWFGNAVGDIRIPKYAGSQVFWADSENADAVDGASGFTEVTLSPKRLTSYITISSQFLAQSPEDAEAILIADLARSIAEKIDKTVFGSEAGDDTKPAGLFNGDYVKTGATDLTAVTFDDVLGLEAEVEGKNGTDFVFVTDPKVKYALRGTQMASGLQMVWDRGEIDGRKSVVSNSVAPKGLLCFDPRDLAAASWDNEMVITVDPYTLAGKNQIKIVVNYLFDAKLKGDRISAEIFE
jgi:HK97 family phage major capsid protein